VASRSRPKQKNRYTSSRRGSGQNFIFPIQTIQSKIFFQGPAQSAGQDSQDPWRYPEKRDTGNANTPAIPTCCLEAFPSKDTPPSHHADKFSLRCTNQH
jgi:hypothetical protein